MAAAGRSVMSDSREKNPFALPTDEDLFTNREKSRAATMEVRCFAEIASAHLDHLAVCCAEKTQDIVEESLGSS
mgnify:CR=1 FL=1